ncbi:hypothetical protein GGR55DRAFT_666681 [Xylaria sp. FL0064]|nr:hypothetical protein GGR55DRAFT_666681 [Xylaria sp. FL0064]
MRWIRLVPSWLSCYSAYSGCVDQALYYSLSWSAPTMRSRNPEKSSCSPTGARRFSNYYKAAAIERPHDAPELIGVSKPAFVAWGYRINTKEVSQFLTNKKLLGMTLLCGIGRTVNCQIFPAILLGSPVTYAPKRAFMKVFLPRY